MSRCRVAISLGWYPGVPTAPADAKGLHSRCMLEADGHINHVAKGLPQFDYQRWHYLTGDRRCYQTDREDQTAWEIE